MQLGAWGRRHGTARPAHAASGRETAVAPVGAGSMRPQDCRRSQWPCCKRCGRSGRPARLLTGRGAAAIVSCAATADPPAPSPLPPKVGSALAMPLSSACTPLATAATPPARRNPTPSRSQVGTRCTASTAIASCRRHPFWTAEYLPLFQLQAAPTRSAIDGRLHRRVTDSWPRRTRDRLRNNAATTGHVRK